MRSKRPILLVEDDQVDQMTVKRAFKALALVNKLVIKNNGEEGFAYLAETSHPAPCLILLDLNMPRMGGFDFMKAVKSSPSFKKIPIVVLTTSDEETDKVASFNLGAAGYVVKPPDSKNFADIIRVIDQYWSLSEMP